MISGTTNVAERLAYRLDAWVSEADAAFVARLAEAEGMSASGTIRRLIRIARAQTGYQPQHQAAE
jgi:hypothetical protein